MMGYMFYFVSAGVALYWLTGQFVGMAQQFMLNKLTPTPPPPAPVAGKKKGKGVAAVTPVPQPAAQAPVAKISTPPKAEKHSLPAKHASPKKPAKPAAKKAKNKKKR